MSFDVGRRQFLAGAGVTLISLSELHPVFAQQASHAKEAKPEVANVKALVFDTFGTVVDWRSSVIAEGVAWGKAKGLRIDWAHSPTAGDSVTAPPWTKFEKAKFPGPAWMIYTR